MVRFIIEFIFILILKYIFIKTKMKLKIRIRRIYDFLLFLLMRPDYIIRVFIIDNID
jgi:hypothetical protein